MRKLPRTTMLIAGVLCAAITTNAEGPLEDWDTSLNGGLTLTDGNSETVSLNVGLLSERGAPEDDKRCVFGADYNYGENTDKAGVDDTTVDNLNVYANHRDVLSGNSYWYADVSYFRDDVADIDYRVTLGPGLGQYLIRDAQTVLGVEAGVAYVWDELGGVSDDNFALRFGQNLDYKISETARLFESVEYSPVADDWDMYLLNAEVGVEAEMTDSLSLRLVFQDRYDSDPAPGNDNNDITLVAGVSYKL